MWNRSSKGVLWFRNGDGSLFIPYEIVDEIFIIEKSLRMKNTTMVDKRSSKKMIMVNEEKQRVEKLEEDDNGEKKFLNWSENPKEN